MGMGMPGGIIITPQMLSAAGILPASLVASMLQNAGLTGAHVCPCSPGRAAAAAALVVGRSVCVGSPLPVTWLLTGLLRGVCLCAAGMGGMNPMQGNFNLAALGGMGGMGGMAGEPHSDLRAAWPPSCLAGG